MAERGAGGYLLTGFSAKSVAGGAGGGLEF